MKFNLNKRRKYLLAGGLLLVTATPSFALFGIGDIVFDPTSYASLVSQLTTLESQYNMLKNNVTHFSFKQQWQTTLNALKNANVANMFGETAGVNIALNSNSPSASLTAWKTATVPVSAGILYGVTALFGPIFVPLLMTKSFRSKFFHFLDVLIGFAMIRAVAAAFIFVWSGFMNAFIQQTFNGNYSMEMWLANLIPCTMVFIAFIINMLFIPSMTQAIFGGAAGLASRAADVAGGLATVAIRTGGG